MPEWGQQLDAFKSKRRVAPTQGMGEETQEVPSSGNTGVGAILGGTAAGLAALRQKPLAAESLAAAGAGVGDIAETALQQALDPQREVTVGGALKSAGKEMILSLVGGGAVRGIVAGGDKMNRFAMGKLFERVSSNTTPEAQVALSVIDKQAAAAGIPALTPAERTSSAWFDFFDNIAKNSLMGANLYQKFIVKRQDILTDLAGEYTRQFGAISRDPASLGDMLLSVTKHNKELSQIPAKMIRNQVEDTVSRIGLRADVSSLRTHAQGVLKNVEVTGGLAAKRQGKSTAKSIESATEPEQMDMISGAGAISEAIMGFSNSMPLGDVMKLRTSLLDLQRGLRTDKKLKNAPVAKHVGEQIELLNHAIENGLRQPGSSPDLLAAWKKSNQMFSSTSSQFGDKLGEQIIKAATNNPAGIVKAVMKADTENGYRLVKKAKQMLVPDNIKDIHNLPVSTSTLPWKKFQAGMVKEIFDEAFDLTTKTHSGVKFANRLNDIGRGTLTEAFGSQTTKELFDFATTLSVIQKKNPIGIGSMGTQMIQAGAVLSLPRKVTGEAVAVILGPAMLAKVFTTREGVRLFRQGLLMERTDPRWRAMMGRLVTLGSASFEEQKPRPQKTSTREDPLLSQLLSGPAITQ